MDQDTVVFPVFRCRYARIFGLFHASHPPSGGDERDCPCLGSDAATRCCFRGFASIHSAVGGNFDGNRAVCARNAAQMPEADAASPVSGIENDRIHAAFGAHSPAALLGFGLFADVHLPERSDGAGAEESYFTHCFPLVSRRHFRLPAGFVDMLGAGLETARRQFGCNRTATARFLLVYRSRSIYSVYSLAGSIYPAYGFFFMDLRPPVQSRQARLIPGVLINHYEKNEE